MTKTSQVKVNDQENKKTDALQKTEKEMTSSTQNAEQGLQRRNYFTNSLFGSSPMTMIKRLRDEMDRLFENFGFGRSSLAMTERDMFSRRADDFFGSTLWSPQVEMLERDDKLVVKADLPGLNKDEINVELTDDALLISGERRTENEEKKEGFYHSERSYGSFFRRIPLPEGINTEDADATFSNGVLEIKMPLPEKRQTGRRLEIKDGTEETK